MPWSMNFLLLAAEATTETASSTPWYASPMAITAAILGGTILAYIIGRSSGSALRMPEHNWKLGIILCTLVFAVGVILPKPQPTPQEVQDGATKLIGWPPNLGVDLKGGAVLVFEVEAALVFDEEEEEEEEEFEGGIDIIDINAVVEALKRRIDPGGVKEIEVRALGDDQVEIIIPVVDQLAIDNYIKTITKAGFLQFRIVANLNDHSKIIDLAKKQPGKTVIIDDEIIDEIEQRVGLWVRVGRDLDDKNRINVKVAGRTRKVQPLKVNGFSRANLIRNTKTKELITLPHDNFEENEEGNRVEDWLENNGHPDIEILMATNDGINVQGKHLQSVGKSIGEQGGLEVDFVMKDSGAVKMGKLTGNNVSDDRIRRQLGIVLDGELLSAPGIQSKIDKRGRITGRFTVEEIDFLIRILKAGKLPAVLNEKPAYVDRIDPLLGAETIKSGSGAILFSLGAVLVFMALYYRFAGMVACMALLANLVLVLALMILVSANFSLHGLAGLVLTVGMSVDANVLIFERIREEMNRGAALRMAIRNGFARATTTIVDANLTTLITAIVLYAIGTPEIRGFAVTLIFGIVMSMYTAIFCSRVIFDIGERKRWITKLGMSHIVGATTIDFIGKRKIAAVASVLLITTGLAAVAVRGTNIFDIDLLGGTSATVTFNDSTPAEDIKKKLSEQLGKDEKVAELMKTIAGNFESTEDIEASMRNKLGDDFREDLSDEKFRELALEYHYGEEIRSEAPINFTVTTVSAGLTDDPDGNKKDTIHKIRMSLKSEELYRAILLEVFQLDDGKSLVASYAMNYDENAIALMEVEETKKEETSSSLPGIDLPEIKSEVKSAVTPKTPTDEKKESPAVDSPAPPKKESPEKKTEPSEVPPKKKPATPPSDDGARNDLPADNVLALANFQPDTATKTDATVGDSPIDVAKTDTWYETTFTFSAPVNAPTLEKKILAAASQSELKLLVADIRLQPIADREGDTEQATLVANWKQESETSFQMWSIGLHADKANTINVFKKMSDDFSKTPVLRNTKKSGGKMASKAQWTAAAALLTSLLGIVGYIWIRFQNIMFGLAAVVALVHDVLFTLGAIAVSFWLANYLGFLKIEEFRISLPIVAAFLTIIGYSLNDTIVVFDRIREVRGKRPDITGEMINTSVNQTLSRTLLTSVTTLLVVAILYWFGGDGIHGFAYALLIGVVVGTYSSIFVASPVLLWMTKSSQTPNKKAIEG